MGDFRGFSSSPHCRRGSQLQNNTWYFTVLYPLEIKFHGWEIHGNPQSRHKISSHTYMFISVHLDAFLRIPKIFFHFFPAPSHSKKNEELIEVHLLPLVQAVVSADLSCQATCFWPPTVLFLRDLGATRKIRAAAEQFFSTPLMYYFEQIHTKWAATKWWYQLEIRH